jgi:hypothetical protein
MTRHDSATNPLAPAFFGEFTVGQVDRDGRQVAGIRHCPCETDIPVPYETLLVSADGEYTITHPSLEAAGRVAAEHLRDCGEGMERLTGKAR